MQVKLIVVEGHARQREVVLEVPAVIGRSRAASVTIGDPKVSRQHCFLEERGGMLMLRDNGSLNGTLLDGQRVEGEAVIRPGAKLTVGPLTFVVLYEPTTEEADTGRMPRAGGPDFQAFMGGADEEEAEAFDGEGEADEASGGMPALKPGPPAWVPPTAAGPSVAPLVPPPAAAPAEGASILPPGAAPNLPASPKPSDGGHRAGGPSFDWLAGATEDAAPAAPFEAGGEIAAGPAGEQLGAQQGSSGGDAIPGDSDEAPTDPVVSSESSEAAPSAASSPSKPAKKNRWWWPFGRKKTSAAAKRPATAQPTATEQAEVPSTEDPKPAEEPKPDVAQPADPSTDSHIADPVAPSIDIAPAGGASGSSSPASPPTDDDDDELERFLKGIGH